MKASELLGCHYSDLLQLHSGITRLTNCTKCAAVGNML